MRHLLPARADPQREVVRARSASLPLLGAAILTAVFVKSCIDLADPANSESGDSWLGIGPPLIIGIGFLVLGVVLMLWWRFGHVEFFRRKPEVVDPAVAAAAPGGDA